MANPNFPAGLKPWGPILRSHEYTLSSAYAQDLFIGDPVIANGTSRDVVIATAGTTNKILGSILAIYDANKVPLAYWPTGNAGIGYVVVADHPDQEYIVQEDNVGSDLDANDANGNINLVSGSGSTVFYRSGWQLDSSDTGGNTAGDQIRLIKIAPTPDNALGTDCKWICRINAHQASVGIVGAGV